MQKKLEGLRAKVDELVAYFEAEGLNVNIDIWLHSMYNQLTKEDAEQIASDFGGKEGHSEYEAYEVVRRKVPHVELFLTVDKESVSA